MAVSDVRDAIVVGVFYVWSWMLMLQGVQLERIYSHHHHHMNVAPDVDAVTEDP